MQLLCFKIIKFFLLFQIVRISLGKIIPRQNYDLYYRLNITEYFIWFFCSDSFYSLLPKLQSPY